MFSRYVELGPLEEALALTTNTKSKNMILGALDLNGPMYYEAMSKAAQRLGEAFPHLGTNLKEIKQRGRYRFIRDYSGPSNFPFYSIEHEGTLKGLTCLDIALRCLAPSLTRDWDLFRDPLFELHLIKLSQERHLLACVMSHVAADANTLGEIVKVLMERYHELVTGETNGFFKQKFSSSTSVKRSARNKETVISDYWKAASQAFIPYRKCCLAIGSGNPGSHGEHHAKRLLPEETSQIALLQARINRVPFVDHLMATIVRTIVIWNKSRRCVPSEITGALTVNMKGRFQKIICPNNASVLYFRFGKDQRKDLRTLATAAYRMRMRLHRDEADLKYLKGLAKITHILSYLPLASRRRLLLSLLEKHQTTFALGFTGVMWPRGSGRNLSSDSYLVGAGGLDIVEAQGLPYRIVSSTPLYLAVYFFRKKLNLILSAAAWKYTNQEAKDLLDLIVETLVAENKQHS